MSKLDPGSLEQLAAQIVDKAKRAGVDVAEVQVRSGWELTARVRLGDVELVQEAGHKTSYLRVLKDQKVALTSSSDLSADGIERSIADAISLLELSQPDPFAGPADAQSLAKPPYPDLDLYDPEVESVDADAAIQLAREAERAALDSDERLSLSEGATFSRVAGASALVLSTGFSASQKGSYASLVVSPVAMDEGDKRRRGHYWSARRHLAQLEPAIAVGQEAARRTLRQLGARKVPTCEASVIFDQDTARSIVGTFAGCVLGGALWRKSSYLVDRLGSAVASPLVTLVDDPHLPRAPGSRQYDGDGLPTRENIVVEQGVLKTYLLDTYSARKLKLACTHSGSRGGASVSSGTTNFIMKRGATSPAELIASTQRGLLVTEMMGFGFNAVTGDFSRGAAGFWIEDGAIAFPVSELTISGNLEKMLKDVDAVGDDLDLKTSTAAPSFRVASMTIAGA